MPVTDAARLRTLAHHSVAVIRAGQAASGAYIASPNFPVYHYSWLRDGAFIADAMSRAGEIASAEAFFGWCAGVLVERRGRVARLLARRAAGELTPTSDFLHTRYTLDGRESDAEWENFQLDGYGAWLWALDEHRRRHGRSIEPFVAGAALSAAYVAAFWTHPSYDWWEEHAVERHTSTLAAIHAGLRAAECWPELPAALRSDAGHAASELADLVHADAARLGHLPKWLGGDSVDASLIAAATPFAMLAVDDPLMVATVALVEAELVHAGGVHRYALDTYYGGGEWLLLAALLGWHQARTGRRDEAIAQLEWVARHATPEGNLPEQVDDHLLAPERQADWIERWGPVATPLLWSHAMYLTLALELGVVVAPVEAAVEAPVDIPVQAR
ncbi:MAG TPA: glycoside hydrolase family 15 protein [Patescibacteria group bacterium]|nr:glycoside hydrolase family 15 protein [Patescibacteria group bacterium]